MKINLIVLNTVTGKIMQEDYVIAKVSEDGAYDWAKGLIKWFNSTLHEGESPRRLIDIEILSAHMWRKVNAFTLYDKGPYDEYKCVKCGITAKRRSLREFLNIDKKFTNIKTPCDLLIEIREYV